LIDGLVDCLTDRSDDGTGKTKDEIYGTKGIYKGKIRYHAKGRAGRAATPTTHLTAVVREIPMPKEGETEVKLSVRAEKSRRHITNAFREQWDRIERLRRIAFEDGKDPWAPDVVPSELSTFKPVFTRRVPFHGNKAPTPQTPSPSST